MDLHQLIRDIPDFPQPGIMFKDITPLAQRQRRLVRRGGRDGRALGSRAH